MKIGVLSDAHGNALYVKKCIERIKEIGVNSLIFLGDAIGYGDQGRAAIDMLMDIKARFLLGNHEAMLLGLLPLDNQKNTVYRLKKDMITSAQENFLKTLVPFETAEIMGKKILFVHGTPFEPLTGYLYENSDKAPYANLEFNYIFMGHTHRPYIQKAGKTYLINVGSCGLPRDIGNLPSFAVFDTQTLEITLERVVVTREEIEHLKMDIHPDVRTCLFRNFNGGD